MYTVKLNIGSWTTPVLGGGYILASPDKSKATIIKQVDDDNESISRITIGGELGFYGDEFDTLKSIKETLGDFIDAKVYFDGDERVEGILNLSSGSWDENERFEYMPFQSKDVFTDIFKNEDYKHNLGGQKSVSAWIRFTSVLYTGTEYCYPGNPADFQNNVNPDGTANPSGIASSEWAYFTIISADVCDDGGRTYIFVTTYITFESTGYTESEFFPGWYLKTGTATESVSIEIPNRWTSLYTIIEQLLLDMDSTINISESTYCTYFTVDKPVYNHILFSDKSNVKRISATIATFEYITFSELMDYLKYMFNLSWTIEDGYFKLKRPESLSLPDFEIYPKHDFTEIDNGNSISDNQKNYKYSQDNKYYRETWEYEFSDDDRFYSVNIDYDSLNETKKEYSLLNINNNVAYLIADPEDANDDGLVIVATEGTSTTSRDIINVTVDGAEEVNYYMSALKLVQENQLTNRSYSTGILNGTTTSFTIRPDKEILYKNVPVQDINDIDFSYLVKCELGNVKCHYLEIGLDLKGFATFKGRL